jgi:hypothetical protein
LPCNGFLFLGIGFEPFFGCLDSFSFFVKILTPSSIIFSYPDGV